MSDFRNDPNFVRHEMSDYDNRVQWAAVAVILLLVGGRLYRWRHPDCDEQPGGRDDRVGRLHGFDRDDARAAASVATLAFERD
jgi:hypothetical protein